MIGPLRTYPFRLLFVALIVTLGASTFLERGTFAAVVLRLLITITLLSALNAVSGRRLTLVLGLSLFVPAVVAPWVGQLLNSDDLLGIGAIFGVLFLGLTAMEILGHVLRARRVTTEILYGGVATYLLLGVIGAFIYQAINVWQPGALSFPDNIGQVAVGDATRFSTFTYYSFVTLTTLGYGDITPITRLARSAAILEAVMGQLYLAVLIARLVGLHIVQAVSSDRGDVPLMVWGKRERGKGQGRGYRRE